MFKVMIIDDEPIIRKGIRNILNWKKFDCEICGEASDGEEGKNLIKKLRPDILITDIRMPETDGLDMIREIKDTIPNCRIIILTGYRDFDYVQEAIKLGVFDFVLKPSKIEELTAVIGRAVHELKYLKNKAEELDKLKKMFEQNIPILKEKLLYDILYELNSNTEDIMSRASLLGIHIQRFVLLVAEIDKMDTHRKSQHDIHLYQFGVINTFEEIFSERYKVTSISIHDNAAAFILQLGNDEDEYIKSINEDCAYLQEMITNCFGFTVTIAVSTDGFGIMRLPQKLKECREALNHKFYLGNNSIILYSDLDGFFQFQDDSVLEKYQKSLIEGIKKGNEEDVKESLADIMGLIENLPHVDMEYLKTFYWGTITYINNIRRSVAKASHEKKVEPIHIPELYPRMEECISVTEWNALLKKVSFGITARINQYNHKNIKLILRKAMDYLQEHYTEQVTLNEVADNIYVSASHISRMFKKELGRNFVDYLNGLRLEKAKELLKDPKYKTYEVAEMVGIPDAHYFSRLFRKHEGITPTAYRDSSCEPPRI